MKVLGFAKFLPWRIGRSPIRTFDPIPQNPAKKVTAGRIGATIVLFLTLVALIGPFAISHPPNQSDFAAGRGPLGLPVGPCAEHWLGTDTLYRDLLSRIVVGARLSLIIAICGTFVTVVLGTTVGTISGLCHNSRLQIVDSILMRAVDAALAFPYLLLVMAIGALVDRADPITLVIVLGTTGWLGISRIVRGKTIQLKNRDFLMAPLALGQSRFRIVTRHLMPNIAGPIIVAASSCVASMILAESVLSYLNVGIQPPTATWGRMLREGQTFFTADPRLVAVPAIAIVLAVIGFNLLGEGLRDALDPHGH